MARIRYRFSRAVPRLLRDSLGSLPASAEHRAPPHFASHEGVAGGALSFDYDDGNGLWITSGETPSDQGFFGKYYPQG